jgi:adenosine deaminase
MIMDTALPRVELHRHLEGSIRLTTVIEIAKQKGISLPAYSLSELEKLTWITKPTPDILDILPSFSIFTRILADYDICRRVACETLEDAAAEGINYLELRFSPLFMAESHNLDPLSVTAAVCEAWQDTQNRLPMRSKLIVILSRTYGPEACQIELNAALAYCQKGITGVDLAGDEARFPAELFIDHFRQARTAGLHITTHAGEFRGAESVRTAILELGAERIGHAVHAVDDPSTVDLLAERGVAIECCPTSNYYTCSVPSLKAHPLPKFLRNGIRATINADDPSIFGNITLEHEYQLALDEIGLTQDELRQVQRNGIEAAFITTAEKSDIWESFSGEGS